MSYKFSFKKVLSLLLTLAVLVTSTFTAYATPLLSSADTTMSVQATQIYKTLDKEQQLKVEKDLAEIKSLGILDGSISYLIDIKPCINKNSTQVTNSGFTYTVQLDNFINNITILSNNREETVYYIQQDEIENILTVKNDGTLLLDGNEIIFSNQTAETVQANETITFYQDNPPYGSSSDYNQFYDYVTDSNVGLSKAMKNIAATVFYAIIGSLPVIGPGAAAVGIASVLYVAYVELYPDTEYLSYQSSLYYHRNASSLTGYINSYGGYVTKYYTSWYAAEDFVDYVETNVYYEIKQIV